MKYIILILSLFTLYSCNRNKIEGQWILKSVDNTAWHNEKKMIMNMFETEYNKDDKDKMRIQTENEINLIYDSLKKDYIGNVYDFKANKTAQITINGRTDSVKWFIEDQQLIIDEPAMKGTGEALRYNYTLLKDSLIMKLVLENDTMIMQFKKI